MKVHASYTGPNNKNWTKDIKVKSFLYKHGNYNVAIQEIFGKITVIAAKARTPENTYTLKIKNNKVSKETNNVTDHDVFKIEEVLESIKWKKDLGLASMNKLIHAAVWK